MPRLKVQRRVRPSTVHLAASRARRLARPVRLCVLREVAFVLAVAAARVAVVRVFHSGVLLQRASRGEDARAATALEPEHGLVVLREAARGGEGAVARQAFEGLWRVVVAIRRGPVVEVVAHGSGGEGGDGYKEVGLRRVLARSALPRKPLAFPR
jgi:hypothetical protein